MNSKTIDRLADQLSNDYSLLENTLRNNGYPLMGTVNGFNLYQFSTKLSIKGSDTYFAMKRSDANNDHNRVEEAIFWEAYGLADAIDSLQNLPVRPVENYSSGKSGKTILLESAVAGGLVGAGIYALTKTPVFGIMGFFGGATVYVFSAAMIYIIKYDILPKIRYNLDLRQAKKGFKDSFQGKSAIREALECAEILQAKT